MNWMDELRRILGRARTEPSMAAPPGNVTCEEAAERVFEWLDGELQEEMASRVGTHLETCARCYPMLRFEQGFREAVSRAAGGIGGAPRDLESRILKALHAEGGDPPREPPES